MAGSTPIYGFPYPESSDLVANYPALGQDLAEDIEGVIAAIPPGGLSMANPTSIANSGGSASASGGEVTFTAVNSISLNGVFTSSYENYRITYRALSSANVVLFCRLRASGSDNTTTSSYVVQLVRSIGTSVTAINPTNTYWDSFGGSNTAYGCTASYDIFRPQLAAATTFLGQFFDGTNYIAANSGYHTQATAYDGFTLYPSSGTITGTIRVYGYKKS